MKVEHPLKVAHVLPSLGIGGAERNLLYRIRFGNRDRLRHTVVSLLCDMPLRAEFTRAGATVESLEASSPRDIVRRVPALVALLRSLRPDVIHTQLPIADVVGRLGALLAGRVPVVSSLQNLSYDARATAYEMPHTGLRFVLRSVDRLLASLTRCHFIAVSEAVKRSYIQNLAVASSRVVVIHNAIDFEPLRRIRERSEELSRFREHLGLREPVSLLLHVGRHVAQKGLEYLVDAMRELADTDAHLVLVGSGTETEALRARAERSGVAAKVLILGSRNDVPSFLAVADLFVFPSLYEGLPLALAEAMAAGLPIIASNVPEIRETVGNTAVLVEPGNVTALSGAIRRLLSNRGAQSQLGLAARRRAEELFDANRSTPRFEATLLAAAARRSI